MALELQQKSQIIEAASAYKPKPVEKSKDAPNLVAYRNKYLTFKPPTNWDYRYDYGISEQSNNEHTRLTEIPNFLVQCASGTDSFFEMRQISKHLLDPLKQGRGGAFNFIGEIRSYAEAHQYLTSLGNYLYLAANKGFDIRGTIQRNVQLALDKLKHDIKLPLKAQTLGEIEKLQTVLNMFKGGSFVTQEMDFDLQEARLRTEHYLEQSKPQVQEWKAAAFISSDRNKRGLSVEGYIDMVKKRGTRMSTNYQELNSLGTEALSLTKEEDRRTVLDNVSYVFKKIVESDKGAFLGKDSFDLGIYLSQFLKTIPTNLITNEIVGNADFILERLQKDVAKVPTETDFDYQPRVDANLTFLGKQLNSMRTYLIK
jgi:hypothetical protein